MNGKTLMNEDIRRPFAFYIWYDCRPDAFGPAFMPMENAMSTRGVNL